MAVTAPGSDVWVLSTTLVRQKALEQTQKVPPQAQKVPLTVAHTTAMTPWERHLAFSPALTLMFQTVLRFGKGQ